jgi:hypothetical protein
MRHLAKKSDYRKAESEIKRHLRDWKKDKEMTDAN